MNKKIVGLVIIVGFVLLCALLLFFEPFEFSTITQVLFNCIVIFFILIWNSSIPVSEPRKKAVSAFLWYWFLWDSLFSSIEALLT